MCGLPGEKLINFPLTPDVLSTLLTFFKLKLYRHTNLCDLHTDSYIKLI